MQEGDEIQFDKQAEAMEGIVDGYDFHSVMHYDTYAFRNSCVIHYDTYAFRNNIYKHINKL